MDGPVEQPQQQTPTSPPQDEGWTSFVNQQTQKTQNDANDPKWQDFVQSHAEKAVAPPPTQGEVGKAVLQPFADLVANHIQKTVSPAPPSAEDKTIDDDMAKFRNSKDFQEGAANFSQLAQDVVIKPAINGFIESFAKPNKEQIDLANEALKQSLTPYPEGELGPFNEPVTATAQKGMDIASALAGQVSAHLGLSGAAQAAATPIMGHEAAQGFGANVGQLPFIAEGAMRTPGHPLNTITQAKGSGVLDGEEAYFGTKELPPEQQAAIDQAHSASQPVEAPPAPDIHQIARNIAHEVIDQRDRIVSQQETLRTQLSELQDNRTADLDAQIKEIQDAKQGGYGKLQSLMEKRNEISSQGDTPEMTDIRQKIQDLDYQRRDLAPKVAEVYRSAAEFAPQEAEKAHETATEAEKPLETPQINPTSTKPLEEQKAYIANDISQKLTALGRPQEEANAAAQLEAARYETLAAQYPKFSAEEWYNRESANLKAGREQARTLAQKPGELHQFETSESEDYAQKVGRLANLEAEIDRVRTQPDKVADLEREKQLTQKWLDDHPAELNQPARGKIRLATDEAKATITSMKNSNASTLIHEKGHEWTDQIVRLSDEGDAPEQLKKDANTLLESMGYKKSEEYFDGKRAPRGTAEYKQFVKGHERLARGFERYLMEGVAPSRQLAGVFAKFKQWLTAIYQTVEKLRSPISDDIRDVFDRLLSANPEKTVLAPDHESGAMLANIHERDAVETPAEKAAPVRDNIVKEIKSTARLHDDKEAENAVNSAEQTSSVASNPAQPEPTPLNTPQGEPQTLGSGGSAIEPESGAVRTESANGTSGKPATGTEKPILPPEGNVKGAAEEGAAGGTTSEGSGTATSPTQNFGRSKSYYVNPKGVINFDLFKTPEDIQNYLQEWAENHPDKISEARGGVATLDQTVKLAQSMGMTAEELKARKVGELYDGPKQVAAAQLFIQSAQRIKAAADAARASGDPEKVANFFADLEDHKDFHDMFLQQVGISAEASRALGARRAIRKLGGFKEAMDIGELFQKMTGTNMKDAKAQADLFASLETPEQISKMAQKTREANWFDYMIAYRNNNLLSGPVTHLHYADGNLLNLLYKLLKTAVASAIPGGPQLGETGAMLNSMVMGAQKGWEAAKAAWQDGIDKSFQDTIENYKSPTQVKFNPTFDKFLGQNSVVGKSIRSIHSLFYTMNYEQDMASQAFRQALREGLDEQSDAFNNRISDLITTPTPEMMAAADKSAKRSVYMANPEWGTALSSFNQFANRTAVGRFLFPFAKMEMNVKVESLLNNTVLGLFSKDVRANLMGANGPEARAIQIAGMSLGTSVAGLTWAASDYINGNGPADANKRKVWLLTHTPNSIQIGHVAIPLRALGNVGQVLMAGAEIRDAFEGMSEDESKQAAAHFMEHVSRVAFEGTFIQNVQSVTQAMFHPDEYGAQYLQNVATGFVPYATLLAQSNRYIDPFQREVYSQGLSNLYGITDYAKSRIPGASQTLPERVDVLGNPIPNDNWLAAGSYEKYITDPIVQKLQSMGAAISKPKRSLMSVPLNDEQYHDYAVTSGQLVHQNLSWMLNAPSFDQMPRAAQLKEVSKGIGEARKIAGQEIMFNNPEIMQQAIAKKRAAYQ